MPLWSAALSPLGSARSHWASQATTDSCSHFSWGHPFKPACSPHPQGVLEAVLIDANGINGSLPACLFDSNSTLFQFSAAANNLAGSIPDAFGGAARLQSFAAGGVSGAPTSTLALVAWLGTVPGGRAVCAAAASCLHPTRPIRPRMPARRRPGRLLAEPADGYGSIQPGSRPRAGPGGHVFQLPVGWVRRRATLPLERTSKQTAAQGGMTIARMETRRTGAGRCMRGSVGTLSWLGLCTRVAASRLAAPCRPVASVHQQQPGFAGPEVQPAHRRGGQRAGRRGGQRAAGGAGGCGQAMQPRGRASSSGAARTQPAGCLYHPSTLWARTAGAVPDAYADHPSLNTLDLKGNLLTALPQKWSQPPSAGESSPLNYFRCAAPLCSGPVVDMPAAAHARPASALHLILQTSVCHSAADIDLCTLFVKPAGPPHRRLDHHLLPFGVLARFELACVGLRLAAFLVALSRQPPCRRPALHGLLRAAPTAQDFLQPPAGRLPHRPGRLPRPPHPVSEQQPAEASADGGCRGGAP